MSGEDRYVTKQQYSGSNLTNPEPRTSPVSDDAHAALDRIAATLDWAGHHSTCARMMLGEDCDCGTGRAKAALATVRAALQAAEERAETYQVRSRKQQERADKAERERDDTGKAAIREARRCNEFRLRHEQREREWAIEHDRAEAAEARLREAEEALRKIERVAGEADEDELYEAVTDLIRAYFAAKETT